MGIVCVCVFVCVCVVCVTLQVKHMAESVRKRTSKCFERNRISKMEMVSC